MTKLIKLHKRKFVLGLAILALFVGFKVLQHSKGPEKEAQQETNQTGAVEKQASTISFGSWDPEAFREVLGTVESDSEVNVKAELSGTIDSVLVKVGDTVGKGQTIARYKIAGDPTAINYQSALNSLQTTKLSSENSVRSSEIALQNAKDSLAQTIAQQDQTYAQAYEALKVAARNTENVIANALDVLDQFLLYSNKYRFNQALSYYRVGNNNTIEESALKSIAGQKYQEFKRLQDLPYKATEAQVISYANARLNVAKDLREAVTRLEQLVEKSTISDNLSEAQKQTFVASVEGLQSQINGEVSSLQSQIESAKGVREQVRLGILNAQNAVKSAEQNLELAQAQADASVIGAQNQVNLAAASQADLYVKAPIAGKVSEKTVNVGDLVSPGSPLFSIVNEQANKKVVAFLTLEEWESASKADTVEVRVGNQSYAVTDIFLSPKLNTQTQKVLAEFTIPGGITLVGNLAKVLVPFGSSNENPNMVPFSAVSFEPDGAEVLVLGADNIAERRKVQVGKVVVSSIEIIGGLEPEDQVVEYYKRALPGERIVHEKVKKVKSVKLSSQFTDEEIIQMIGGVQEVDAEKIELARALIDDPEFLEFMEITEEDVASLKIDMPESEEEIKEVFGQFLN